MRNMSQEPQTETKSKGKKSAVTTNHKQDERRSDTNSEELKATIKDVERIFENGQAHESEVAKILEEVSKGELAEKGTTKGIRVVDFSVSVVRKHINELNLKGKVKAKAREKGKTKPTILARIA